MAIISILNHKGGTGKTTSALNIGAALAKREKKVLLIDLDPQSNLTEGLGYIDINISIYNSLKTGTPLPIHNYSKYLHLVPSSLDLLGAELELITRVSRETILKNLLRTIKDKYDFILVDCPPALGILTMNALVPSDEILIPLEPEFYAYRGIDKLINIIQQVKAHYNDSLTIAGVFLTKCNTQRVLTENIRNSVQKYFGDKLFKSVIRVNVSLAEAPAKGKDIFSYAPDSNGAKDYDALVTEILQKR